MKRPVRLQPSVWLALLSILCPLLFSSPLLHAQARPLTLREMVDAAGRIFVGTVIETRGGIDNRGEIVTWTTFQVEQTLAGQPASTVMIKQFGGEARGLSTRIPHMRYFTRGEHLMVMFYPESELGFTSPIGMGQGVWNVEPDGDIIGVTPQALQGLGPILKRNGVSSTSVSTISRTRFQGIIRDILKGGATR